MATEKINKTFPIYNSDGTSFHGLELRRAVVDDVAMSLSAKITGDVVYKDNSLVFTMGEYVKYRHDEGEDYVNYVLVNPPTVVREGLVSDNGDLKGMTKYSFEFYHPMYMLSNFPFTDVAVSLDENMYLSESKTFSWIGKPVDFIAKINKNLEGTEWVAVKGERFPEDKEDELSDVLQFDNATIEEAIKTFYETWEVPYTITSIKNTDPLYALGKRFVITFGIPSNNIYENPNDEEPFVFRLGQGLGLKNNSRTPRNNKIVTRIAGQGSENNVPYGYPQIRWYGNPDFEYTKYLSVSYITTTTYITFESSLDAIIQRSSSVAEARYAVHEFAKAVYSGLASKKRGETQRHSTEGSTYVYEWSVNCKRSYAVAYYKDQQGEWSWNVSIESGNVVNLENSEKDPSAYPIYDGILNGEYVQLIKHPFTRKNLMPSIYRETLFNKISPYNSDGTANANYDPNTTLVDYYDAVYSEEYPCQNEINPTAPSYEFHEFEGIKPELGEAEIVGVEAYYDESEMLSASQVIERLDAKIEQALQGVDKWMLTNLKNRLNNITEIAVGSSIASGDSETRKWVVERIDEHFASASYTSPDMSFSFKKFIYNPLENIEWDDTMDDDGNYKQSYFKITLPQLDFDLYACASITEAMEINMRSGACIGCTFPVYVDWDDYKRNFFDESGNFAPNGSQRDLNKYPRSNRGQITVIVKKDLDTFGTIMPNVYQQPHSGDEFVILGISLPESYVENAESRLDGEMKSYMLENNVYYYDYPLKFDEYFLTNNRHILQQIKTNSIVKFVYGGESEPLELFVKQITVKYGEAILPQYDITLTDNIDVVLNAVGQVAEDVEKLSTLISSLRQNYGKNVWDEFNKYLSKEKDDSTPYKLGVGELEVNGDANVKGAMSVGESATIEGNALIKGEARLHQDLTFGTKGSTDDFVQNEKGCAIYWDGTGWCVEADCMNIHKRLYAKTIQVDEVTHVGGENILSDASCIAEAVIPYSDNESVVFYRVLFRKKDGDDRIVYNRWKVGDMAYCQVFNINNGENSDFENKYYWRKVIGTSLTPNKEYDAPFNSDEYHYIDLSNRTGEYDTNGAMRTDSTAGSIPAAEDPIIQMGYIAAPNDDPAMVIERQGVTIISGGGRYRRAVMMWEGIGAGTNPFVMPEPKVKLSPYDVKIVADKFLIKTEYGATYTPPINRGEWSNLPPETGQSDNLHRCYKDDIVQHNGSTWICTYIQGSGQPAYTTEEPSESAANWQVYAQKGTNADVWTIGQDGYWYKNNVKYTDTDHLNGIIAEGKNGTGVEIKGSVATVNDLPATAGIGDCYVVEADRHLYSFTGSSWTDLGVFKGEDGTSSYMHIAYADNVTFDSQGNPTSATGFTITKQKEAYAWLGLRTNESIEDPISYTEYEWNKVEGAQGAQGTSAASLVISDPMIVVNADSSGRAKTAFDKTVTITFRVGDTQAALVDSQSSGVTGVPTGVQATLNYVVYSGILVQATVLIQIPYNNSTFPSTLTVTLSGIDPTTGLTRTTKGTITLVAQKDGDNGEDAINPVLDPPSLLINQDITSGHFDLPIYSTLKVYKGGVDDSANVTIEGVSATGCSATYEQNTKRIIINGWSTDTQGNYYQSATVNVVFLYGGTSRTIQLKVFANLVGTWKQTIEGDVNTAIAQKTTYTVNGHSYTVSEDLGTFVQSSSTLIAKLEQTVGDPEDPTSGTLAYRTSAIEQHVDRIDLSVAEGNRNLHPNPTFANYNPFVNGTNHESGTLVGSVEYGSTIGAHTSIWANEGAQLVALKVLTNTTTAATVLYAYNSPTANPRIRLAAGKTYTWSVLVAGDLDMIASASSLVKGSLYNSETGDQQQSSGKYIRANSPVLWKDTTWKQLYSTFEIPANSEYVWFSWIPFIAVLAGATGRIVYGGIRLEEGTTPTIINYNGTDDKLVKTGINIENHTIKFTTDNFIVENNQGERSAWIDRLGNLGTSGNVFTGLTSITASTFEHYFTSAEYDGNWQDGGEYNEYDYIEEDDYRLVKAGDAYFIAAGLFLIPDIFMLSDIVVFDNSLPDSGDPKQILLPFALPRLYGNTGYIADVVRTKTNYKVGTAHLLDMTELYMLEGKEFTFMTKQTSQNKWLFCFPRLEEHTDNDGMKYYTLDNTHPFDTKDFGTNPLLTIQYKRLRFQIPNGAGVLYTDGIVPVLSQTGNGFLYNNITGF